ncbi:hypothetical protein O1611_g7571 [Lasiodiplodia mahajangana]|uniref:Uncharacterized protein n=1 Tax=Lasiodiplodia mahajangana TaxID=1108764 RepID=A0ACC2JFE7_9PEZI|nr:hypothetical protein O1611_g7571 [Lasiodiplodia mahajangana]
MPDEDEGFGWYVPKWCGVVTSRATQCILGEQSSIEKACPIKPPSSYAVVGLFVSPAYMAVWTLGALITPTASRPTSSPAVKPLRDYQAGFGIQNLRRPNGPFAGHA